MLTSGHLCQHWPEEWHEPDGCWQANELLWMCNHKYHTYSHNYSCNHIQFRYHTYCRNYNCTHIQFRALPTGIKQYDIQTNNNKRGLLGSPSIIIACVESPFCPKSIMNAEIFPEARLPQFLHNTNVVWKGPGHDLGNWVRFLAEAMLTLQSGRGWWDCGCTQPLASLAIGVWQHFQLMIHDITFCNLCFRCMWRSIDFKCVHTNSCTLPRWKASHTQQSS